jgi:hemolysin activation/secretion protein
LMSTRKTKTMLGIPAPAFTCSTPFTSSRLSLLLQAGAAASALLLVLSSPSFAQQPSAGQLVPPSLAPSVRTTPDGTVLPAAPETGAPPGAASVHLMVGDVAIRGGNPALAEETRLALEPIRNRKVSAAEVYAAVNAIEQAYAARGYFLSRVVIPPQTVGPGGTLSLVVVEGFIEGVDAAAIPARVRNRVLTVLGGVVNRNPLTLREFERALLIAGDAAGLTLKTQLSPGAAPGAVRLVLDGTHRPYTVESSGDNSLSDELGHSTATLSGSLNSLFGFGEQIYVNITGAPTHDFVASTSPRRLGALGLMLPIGPDGLALNLEGVLSNTNPINDDADLDTETDYKRLSLRLLYPLIRDRTDTLALRAVFDVIEEEETAPDFDATLYDDRIRALRIGGDWTHLFGTGTELSLGLDLSQGLPVLGSRGFEDATLERPVSRLEAEDDFTKLEGRLRVTQSIYGPVVGELSARGQYSFGDALFQSEQFYLGGPHLLSGYDAGTLSGDSGWLVRGELQYYQPIRTSSIDGIVVPYAFAARGEVHIEEATAVERSSEGANSFGVGARLTVNPDVPLVRQVELGLEAARQDSDHGDKDGWRFNIYHASRF